jgi:uroporphyrinogen-III decarboxylase
MIPQRNLSLLSNRLARKEGRISVRESMKDTKNFILSPGCDIHISIPLENIEAFMKAARE